jgi:hypothetical protein
MSRQEFIDYLNDCSVDINTLSNDEKRLWREAFDKSRGKIFIENNH